LARFWRMSTNPAGLKSSGICPTPSKDAFCRGYTGCKHLWNFGTRLFHRQRPNYWLK